MEPNYCSLLKVREDQVFPSQYLTTHHVHILVSKGTMQFSDGKSHHQSSKDDLVIWQMSNTIKDVTYSSDFDAAFLIVSPHFLQQYNPEMVWATKGFIFIRTNPSFHLHDRSLALIDECFGLFSNRLEKPESPFKRDVLGCVLQIFLYDLWTVYSSELSLMEASDNASRIFLRFIAAVQHECRQHRDVAHYANVLCIAPKYLSQVSKLVSGLPASEWISFYSAYELVDLLNDQSKTLTEVADIMCFESLSHFSRYTKKLLGKTPSDYRKN